MKSEASALVVPAYLRARKILMETSPWLLTACSSYWGWLDGRVEVYAYGELEGIWGSGGASCELSACIW